MQIIKLFARLFNYYEMFSELTLSKLKFVPHKSLTPFDDTSVACSLCAQRIYLLKHV